jgi:hypothetical protein
MNSLNLDPNLRQAFTQQTQQRLLAEAKRARLVKNLTPKYQVHFELKQYSLGAKIKIITWVIQDAGSIIATILRASSNSANA